MKFTLFSVMLLIFIGLSAQLTLQWDAEGIPIRQGVNIEWFRSSLVTDDGGMVFAWSDTRRGDRDVWLQKVDQNGNLVWGEQSEDGDWKEGVMINGEINRQEDIVIINAGDGSIIAAWVDFRNEDAGDVYAQKISSNGTLLWDPAGVPLCLAEDIQISLNIVSDTDGGAYVIWVDSRNQGGTDIYGTHITSDGTIATGWNTDGSPVAAASDAQNQHTFWEDGQGGAVLVWHDKRDTDNENLYMQRIMPNGDLVWGQTGTLVSDAPGIQEKAKIKPVGTSNFIITWRDKRNENDGDIYAQLIDMDGNTIWQNDLAVYAGTGIQRNPRTTSTNDSGLIITWEDGRNDSYYKDIYAQKIDLDGNLLWGEDGVPICTEQNDQLNPRITSDNNSGAYIIWDDGRINGHPHEDIYMQHINSDGQIIFETDGKVVCDAVGEQFSPLIKMNSESKVFTVWGDNRTGSTGLYTQIFDSEGNQIIPEDKIIYYGLNGDAKDYRFLENGDSPVVIWSDTRNSSIANQIFMQVLSANGSLLLEKNGKSITSMTGYDQENLDAVIEPSTNKMIAVWEEIRDGSNKQIFAQATNMNATSLWDTLGVQVADYNSQQEIPQVSVVDNDGTNDIYFGWSDFRDNWDFGIMAQKLNENGNKLWDTEGIVVSDLAGDDKLTDLVGRYFIWQNEIWPDNNVYIKLIDENGNTATGWPNDGLLICGAEANQMDATGMMVPQGIFVAWIDQRSGTNDIYGQIITPEGETLWEDNGRILVSAANDQFIGNFLYDDGIYMIWDDFRNPNDKDIYMQKYDIDGNAQWQDNGIPVVAKEYEQKLPYMVKNNDDFVVFWEDYAQETESDLYAQSIDSDGNLSWDENGLVICDAIKKQNHPLATEGNNGNTFVIWEDTRSSGKTDIYNIYAQMIRIDGSAFENDIVQNSEISAINYPNPFNPTTTISFNLTKNSEFINLEIFNIKGQKIKTLVNEKLAAGRHSYVWNGKNSKRKNVSSGIYFYKIKTENSTYTRKMILMK